MFTKLKNKMLAASVACTALISGAAFADEPLELGDVAASAASTIEGVGSHILTVGSAIIGLAAFALAIRWIKATFF